MTRLGITIGVGVLSLGLVACTKAGGSDKKLDEMKADISAIKKKMDKLMPDPPKQTAKTRRGRFGRQRRALANNSPLGRIERRLARMEQLIQRGGGRGRQRKRARRPDANTIYSIPIKGSASKGPKHALVTVVEGFEFA